MLMRLFLQALLCFCGSHIALPGLFTSLSTQKSVSVLPTVGEGVSWNEQSNLFQLAESEWTPSNHI